MRNLSSGVTAALFPVLFAACAEKDTAAPPPPNVDPVQSPTPASKQIITGSAEFNSTVRISGGKSEVEVKADPFTARFRAEVELNADASNALSLTATDEAGNTSEAAQVEIVHKTGFGYTVALELTRPVAAAGELIGIRARVLDGSGKEVADAPFDFAVSPALASSFTIPGSSPAITREQGVIPGSRQFVAYDLSGVSASGYEFTLTATSTAGKDLKASTTVVVRPAAGNSFASLQFSPSGTSKTVAAGTAVDYSYGVVDLYGNPASTPVMVFTNAPGAVVVDDGISGAGQVTRLSTVGSYTLSFYIAGAGLKGSLQLSVGAGPGALMDLMSSTSLASPNTDVLFMAGVRDGFGNPIPCTAATLSDVAFTATGVASGAVAAKSTACLALGSSNSAFQAVYSFAAEDNYAIEAEYRPGGVASGIKRAAYVTVLAFDNTKPTVAIQNVRHDGVACAASPCVVNPGEFIEFTVSANDNKALSELAYTAFFSTAGGTGTLRTRTVLVPSNAALPIDQPFSFGVPNAIVEDVPLTALAIDGAGNRATSAQFILRITFSPYKGRATSIVVRDLGANIINGPEDIALAPNGDLYISNGGNNDVVVVPSGSSVPTVYANLPYSPGFLTLDAAGKLYLTGRGGRETVGVINTGTPASYGGNYLQYGNANANLWGMAPTQATAAKAVVRLTAWQDGDRLTVGGTDVYELDSNGTCPAASICLTVAVGSTPDAVATALAGCINSGAGCTRGGAAVPANTRLGATVSTTPNLALVLAAKAVGAAGNATTVVGTCPRLLVNGDTLCLQPALQSLLEGHDPTFLVGQQGNNSSVIFRFPFTLTGLPRSETAAEGAFDMAQGGNPHEQFSLAAKDLSTPTTRNLRDFAFYFPDWSQGLDRLRGVRFTDSAGTPIFNSVPVGTRPACGDCIRGTNDTTVPLRRFTMLWDVQLEPRPTTTPLVAPNGCLLVSDNGNGSIYSVDTRDPAAADPLVSLVATGLQNPRGMKFAPSGDLYIAVQNLDAIVKISPSADTTDCF
ncbi:MAG: Ig-like domain-containing protein [Myxococcaceae bacterium]